MQKNKDPISGNSVLGSLNNKVNGKDPISENSVLGSLNNKVNGKDPISENSVSGSLNNKVNGKDPISGDSVLGSLNNKVNGKDPISGNSVLADLKEKVDEIALNMEKLGIAEYLEMLKNPRRLFFINLWMGAARGFGMAIGFTVLAALVLYLLQKIIVLNIPVIGDFIADIVRIVQDQLQIGGNVFKPTGGKV